MSTWFLSPSASLFPPSQRDPPGLTAPREEAVKGEYPWTVRCLPHPEWLCVCLPQELSPKLLWRLLTLSQLKWPSSSFSLQKKKEPSCLEREWMSLLLLNPTHMHSLWKWPLVMRFDGFLSSCLPTEPLKIINSPLLCRSALAKCWHPIHYLPGAGPSTELTPPSGCNWAHSHLPPAVSCTCKITAWHNITCDDT